MQRGTLKELNVKPGDVANRGSVISLTVSSVDEKRGIVYGTTVFQNGLVFNGYYWALDGVEDWHIVSRASDDTQSSQEGEPKLWRDMTDDVRPWKDLTDEEKGALLLAHHEGKVIENKTSVCDWGSCLPMWLDHEAYRVKPYPVRETVEMQWSYEKGGKEGFAHPVNYGATHRITFKTVDGNPDCNSIKMEEL